MPQAPAEPGYTSEQMIQQVHAFLACVEELNAAGLRWPREAPLDANEHATYERILAAHGMPIREAPLTAEELAFCERVEALAAEALAAEGNVQP